MTSAVMICRELVALAREIAGGVRDTLGVELQPEPTLVGVSLDAG